MVYYLLSIRADPSTLYSPSVPNNERERMCVHRLAEAEVDDLDFAGPAAVLREREREKAGGRGRWERTRKGREKKKEREKERGGRGGER